MKNRKVLVLGSDERATLSVVRSLGRKNLCVHLGWHAPDSLVARSRYVSAEVQIPGFNEHSSDWSSELGRLITTEGYDLVIPCTDPVIIPLQGHRDEIAGNERIYLVASTTFEICQNKIKSYDLATTLGVPCPQSVSISNMSELDEVRTSLRFPLYVKPASSFNYKNLSSKAYVRKVHSDVELDETARRMLTVGDVQIQELFFGTGMGVEVLCHHGDVLFAFQHERVHQPASGGGSSYRRSIATNANLLEASKSLMRALDYTGVAMVEFVLDKKSQKWVFLEINARFWGSLPLALAAKADFPYFLYSMLVDHERDFDPSYTTNIYARNVKRDLNWFVENLQADKTDPDLHTRSSTAVMSEIFNLLTLRERFDTLVLDDWKPGIENFRRILRDVWTKVHLRAIERKFENRRQWPQRRARRAAKLIARSKRILFVCKGNICRSPFAEQIARRYLPDVAVESCGYYPKSGRKSPATAIVAARKFQVDLTGHESRGLENDLANPDGIVIVFDKENYLALTNSFTHLNKRIFLLAELGGDSSPYIEDPFGGGQEEFEATYREIDRCVQTLARRMEKSA